MAVKDTTPPGGWADYIATLSKRLTEKYEARNKRIEDVFLRRTRQHKVEIPKEFRATAVEARLPLVEDLIRRVVGLVADRMPVPHVEPMQGQANSTLREQWLNTCYKRLNHDKDVFGEIVDALAADGQAVWKVRLKKHLWSQHGPRKKGEDPQAYLSRVRKHHRMVFPFTWEHVATSTYLPTKDDDGLAEVCEITTRETLPLAWKYNLVPDGSKLVVAEASMRPGEVAIGSYPDKVVYTEYWNRTDYVYLVGDTIVARGKHQYGRPPYFHALASVTSIKDPAYQGISIADPLLSLQDLLDSLITIQTNWAFLNGFPVGRLRPIGDDPMPIDDKLVIEWVPGQTVAVPGYLWEWTPAPPVGQDLNLLRVMLKELADQVSLAPILHGLPPGADSSGALANTMIAVAKSIFGPGVKNLARGFDDMAAFLMHQVEILGDDVPMFYKGQEAKWLELGPKDVDGYYEVEHELAPVVPAERQVLYGQLSNALSLNLVPPELVVEKGLGFENPEEILRQVEVGQARQWPEYRQLLVERWLARLQGVPPPPGVAVGGGGIGQLPQETPPVGPGGFGQPQLPGVQQPIFPGGPLGARPMPGGGPMPGPPVAMGT